MVTYMNHICGSSKSGSSGDVGPEPLKFVHVR